MSVDFNIADRLQEVAEQRGGHWALADGDHPEADRLSFEDLDEDATQLARGLLHEGFEPGDRVLVFIKPSLDFFALVWALFRMGAVPIFIDPAMGTKPVLRAIREADPQRVVAIEAVLWVAKFYPSVFSGVKTWIRPQSVGLLGRSLPELRKLGAKSNARVRHPAGREGLAAVLFTSGSTGFPKGVLYSHGIFDGQRAALGASLGIQPGEVDFSAFPLFSCFSLILGASVVVPNMDTTKPGAVDPTPVLESIDRFGVTYAFGSPAFWRRLVASRRRNALQGLSRVLMAGAPAPPDLLKELLRSISPRADVFTPYGATESLPVSMPSARRYVQGFLTRTLEGEGTWVGRPVEGVELKIIPITDEPLDEIEEELPPNEVGEIIVRSAVTTPGYFMRPVADAAAKIHAGDGPTWHRMGDLGYLDEAGHLWFCGRKSHRVVTRAETVFPVQVEALVNQHPRVFRSALVGVGERGRERPVLVIECRSGERPRGRQDRRRLAGELETASGRPDLAAVLFRASLPVDARHNAKIRRELIKEWAEGHVR
ncbi:MAG: fatty acid CoA ligase family protein [Myxococcota bacterium]